MQHKMSAQVYNQMIERLHYSPIPPIKRYNRTIPAKSLLKRTKRNLFGAVESESVKKFAEEHIREVNEAKQRRWNYDFSKDRPTDGPLQWERVNPLPMVTLTTAAHVVPIRGSNRSGSDGAVLSADELMDERADRANRSVEDVCDESSSVSSLSDSIKETQTTVQTSRILSGSPTPPKNGRTANGGRTLRQAKMTECLRERKRPRSSVPVEESIPVKKVRMLSADSEASSSSSSSSN
uniref:Cyclin-dependent kinase inhibitor domain-containing protein n=1 Tax=Anopheles farauti TaxID=69004 RepID=A0A182Q9C4_9DIPT